MQLARYIEPLAYDIAFWMQCANDPEYPLEELGELTDTLCVKLRALAVCILLVEADQDPFHHNLLRSARLRLRYLERLRQAGIRDDHHQGAGRVDPALDAIVAGDLDLASRLVQMASPTFLRGHEYEDDFHYGRVVGLLCQPIVDVAVLSGEVDAMEASSAQGGDARVAVVRALAGRDQPGFDDAFPLLLIARRAAIDRLKEEGQLEEPAVIAERLVYVEGLAMLRLAHRFGLQTESEYEYCPSLASVPMTRPLDDE